MFRRATPLFALAVTRPSLCAVKGQPEYHEDASWLEANTESAKLHSAEDRYAHEKEQALLAKMMSKMRAESKGHAAAVKKETADKHDEEVGALKAQLASIMGKLDDLTKK